METGKWLDKLPEFDNECWLVAKDVFGIVRIYGVRLVWGRFAKRYVIEDLFGNNLKPQYFKGRRVFLIPKVEMEAERSPHEAWYYFGKWTPYPQQIPKGTKPMEPYRKFATKEECQAYIDNCEKSSVKGVSIPPDIRAEMGRDLDYVGMDWEEIEYCLNEWAGKFVIERKPKQ